MADLGLPELLIILAIIVLVFGPGRILGVASGLGHAIRSFRHGLRDDEPEQLPDSPANEP